MHARTCPGFPEGDYTPFGYVSNHTQFARSWGEVYGGTLRTALDFPGFGWVYPTERRPAAGVAIGVCLCTAQGVLLTRGDFTAAGLYSPYHSANVFAYAWQHARLHLQTRFFQTGDNTLASYTWLGGGLPPGCEPVVILQGYDQEELVELAAGAAGGEPFIRWQRSAEARAAERALPPTQSTYGRPFLNVPDDTHEAAIHAPGFSVAKIHVAADWDELRGLLEGRGRPQHEGQTGAKDDSSCSVSAKGQALAALVLAPTKERALHCNPTVDPPGIVVALRRHPSFSTGGHAVLAPWSATAAPLYPLPLEHIASVYHTKLAEDARFWESAPLPVGDWPKEWRNGFVYDLETTRMVTFPPKGVFRDVWPSWMASYPRVVLAEGSMDMMRLAYADPKMAQRAILSMFRDTGLPNVPCIHAEGQANMVAADGATCGTSPAWCIPFYSIYLVYLRTLDREWLGELYPYLVAYAEWWARYRADRDGYITYKCTWEAGEDCSTRLDPQGSGHLDISGVVRPVETQAAMAHCYYVLAACARELGKSDDQGKWEAARDDFRARTRSMFDTATARFRDVDLRTGSFLSGEGPADYWGVNPRRHSVLSLTALLLGVASQEQARAMRTEVPHYGNPPWSYWPSWTYVASEAASAIGLHRFAGENAASILGRVYPETDRREMGPVSRPVPGVAREYWPKLEEFGGSDAYGWGAHTATLLIRQVVGWRESEDTSTCRFILAPALSGLLWQPGKRYGLANVAYRGLRFSIWLEASMGDVVQVRLEFGTAVSLCVMGPGGESVYRGEAASVHTFVATNAHAYDVVIEEDRHRTQDPRGGGARMPKPEAGKLL